MAFTHYNCVSLTSNGNLTEDQVATLRAIADTFFPSLPDEAADKIMKLHTEELASFGGDKIPGPTAEDLLLFLRASAKDCYAAEEIARMINEEVPKDLKIQLSLVLHVLNTGIGNKLVTGSRSVPFINLSEKEREAALLALANSPFSLVRMLFKVNCFQI